MSRTLFIDPVVFIASSFMFLFLKSLALVLLMTGRIRKNIPCPFSSSKKPKNLMELRNSVRGPYYNRDECALCPSVFHLLFAGSEHSEHRLARSACMARLLVPLRGFPFLLEAWSQKISILNDWGGTPAISKQNIKLRGYLLRVWS